MKTTRYFDEFAAQKHPGIQPQWIEYTILNFVKREIQDNGRIAHWANIEAADGRVLRVITLSDGETVHNAFFDRNFYKRQQRGEEPV
ncbi:membrane protein [Prochlorothrix hollandica PCC 9006 = CALU 1027]|uniref:Membrane protein n=1 Tax=Prochlorothrix hollandica PCC 9006 = CALU 1027 TaxID=317619 RepID=A0A0M2PSJ6_PROHO|nr:membrane protein [Prochlorothrix hollandica PCC 9006 = CALU 1027]